MVVNFLIKEGEYAGLTERQAKWLEDNRETMSVADKQDIPNKIQWMIEQNKKREEKRKQGTGNRKASTKEQKQHRGIIDMWENGWVSEATGRREYIETLDNKIENPA